MKSPLEIFFSKFKTDRYSPIKFSKKYNMVIYKFVSRCYLEIYRKTNAEKFTFQCQICGAYHRSWNPKCHSCGHNNFSHFHSYPYCKYCKNKDRKKNLKNRKKNIYLYTN